jgi:hypothetical protein
VRENMLIHEEKSTPTSESIRYLILTLDYEIFGYGQGDVHENVVGPAARMAHLCEKFGVPMTIFLEVEEYLAFQRHGRELKDALGYDPAGLIREQLRTLVRSGHDIQLHIHPQWFGAHYQAGKWNLQWERSAVDDLFETQEEVTRYIGERKAVIDEMVSELVPGRSVKVFRAGAFNAQPGQKLIKALETHGFVIDSSVVRGLHCYNPQQHLDYRQAPGAKGLWRISTDVATEDPAGRIWEIPIYSVMRRRFHQATARRLLAKFSKNVPRDQQKGLIAELGLRRNAWQFAKFLCQRAPVKLDYDNLSPAKLLQWIRSAPEPVDGELDVVVLIGHTKEHRNDRSFDRLLRIITKDPRLKVVTFDFIANALAASDHPARMTAQAVTMPGDKW